MSPECRDLIDQLLQHDVYSRLGYRGGGERGGLGYRRGGERGGLGYRGGGERGGLGYRGGGVGGGLGFRGGGERGGLGYRGGGVGGGLGYRGGGVGGVTNPLTLLSPPLHTHLSSHLSCSLFLPSSSPFLLLPAEIKMHPWFKDVDWANLAKTKVREIQK
jgi:hypothetical protein